MHTMYADVHDVLWGLCPLIAGCSGLFRILNTSGKKNIIYYRLGAPRKNMTYPATPSTENRNDNQPWMRIPRVKSLENLRLRCRSPLMIAITMTAAMYAIPTWPKQLYCAFNQRQKAGRVQVFFSYFFALCRTRCKILLTNLIGFCVVGHHLSCMVESMNRRWIKGKIHDEQSHLSGDRAYLILIKALNFETCLLNGFIMIIKRLSNNDLSMYVKPFPERSSSSIFSSTAFVTSARACLHKEILYSLCTENKVEKFPWWITWWGDNICITYSSSSLCLWCSCDPTTNASRHCYHCPSLCLLAGWLLLLNKFCCLMLQLTAPQ